MRQSPPLLKHAEEEGEQLHHIDDGFKEEQSEMTGVAKPLWTDDNNGFRDGT